jgi:hypothetical protein
MTMPSSPNTLNMGGTSSPVSVAQELGLGLTTTISMDQAAVRTLAGVGGSGTSWSMSSLWGKSNSFVYNNLDCNAVNQQTTTNTASLIFNVDGTIGYVLTGLSYGSTEWFSPSGGTPGNSYWVKLTRTSGLNTAGMVSGTLYALSANRTASVTNAISGSVRGSAGNIDIYSDAGGTIRVGGGTYDISAEKT